MCKCFREGECGEIYGKLMTSNGKTLILIHISHKKKELIRTQLSDFVSLQNIIEIQDSSISWCLDLIWMDVKPVMFS
jgi:hypothetical protein